MQALQIIIIQLPKDFFFHWVSANLTYADKKLLSSKSCPEKAKAVSSFHFHKKSIKSEGILLKIKASIIFSFMCLLFILMMELFMYFQIWNLWYYFLCFLILRFYILFPLQAYNPPIWRLALPLALATILSTIFLLPWKQFMGFFFNLLHLGNISMWNGFSCA